MKLNGEIPTNTKWSTNCLSMDDDLLYLPDFQNLSFWLLIFSQCFQVFSKAFLRLAWVVWVPFQGIQQHNHEQILQADLSFFQEKFPFFLDTEVAQTVPVKFKWDISYHRGRWTENNSNLKTLFFMFCELKGQKLDTFICKKKIWFFDTPGTPGGASI